jgi:seryl-tRNA synthetase
VIDIRAIREDPEAVARALATRGGAEQVRAVVEADEGRRRLLTEVESLKAVRNRASEAIGQARRRGDDASAEMARMREVADRIKTLDARERETDERMTALLLQIPNLPHPSVPIGASADDNVQVRQWGERRHFAFAPREHFEIGEALGLLDFERASKLAKARFAVMWAAAARLERALGQFMVDLHTREHDFTEVWVPHLVNAETMTGLGLLPKFEDSLFKVVEPDENRTLYLIPTAEVPLTALHGGEILPEARLPLRYCALTPCYRREAGTYGQDMKGMIRQHQFDKVEMVKVTTPAQSYDELESLVRAAEAVLQRLELPYRVMTLSSGDMSFQSAKTYDIEVWLPGQAKYREISSCSNCEAFQARRLGIKFRPAAGGRVEFCHTLNGSGLAVGRTLVAVLENYQEEDGSVSVPAALRPYLGGLDRITART